MHLSSQREWQVVRRTWWWRIEVALVVGLGQDEEEEDMERVSNVIRRAQT